jgi:hypothetical protein
MKYYVISEPLVSLSRFDSRPLLISIRMVQSMKAQNTISRVFRLKMVG